MGISDHLSTLARARWLRWLLVAALLVLYAGWIGYVMIRDKPCDFYLYYLAAYGFTHGADVYGSVNWERLAREVGITYYAPPYRYPPLTAELVWPLLLFPPRWAALVWLIASALAFAVSAWLLGRSSRSPFGMALALGLLLFFVPPLTTLHAGQVNGFLLLALALALYAFARERPHWVGAGVAIGTLLKLVPVAHLAYLGWRRQWRAMLAGVIVVVLLLGSAVPLVGWSGFASYARNFFALGSAGILMPTGSSQSISSFFARLLLPGEGRWYLADAPQLARWLGTIVSVLLVLATVALCWPRGDPARLFALEFALVTTAISMLTPYVWYHQLAVLLIPFFVLAERALAQPRLRWILVPLAIGYLASDVHGLAWHRLEFCPLLASMPFYTTLMLWGLLAWLIVKEKRAR
jgi:hypothetical protein